MVSPSEFVDVTSILAKFTNQQFSDKALIPSYTVPLIDRINDLNIEGFWNFLNYDLTVNVLILALPINYLGEIKYQKYRLENTDRNLKGLDIFDFIDKFYIDKYQALNQLNEAKDRSYKQKTIITGFSLAPNGDLILNVSSAILREFVVPYEILLKTVKSLPLKDIINLCKTDLQYAVICGDKLFMKKKVNEIRLPQALTELSKFISKDNDPEELEKLKLILKYHDGVTKPWANFFIEAAETHNMPEVLKILLQDSRFDPAANANYGFIEAAKHGRMEIFTLLLADRRTDPGAINNLAIREASKTGQIDIVKLLLADRRVNPAADSNDAFISAAERGDVEMMKLLLSFSSNIYIIEPDIRSNWPIIINSYYGNIEAVKFLLADPRVDPSDQNNRAIIYASQLGHLEVVKLLLTNERVNPAAQNNQAIILASKGGHVKIVKLLLKDRRVNPADLDNAAIKEAKKVSKEIFPRKDLEYNIIMEILFNDPRVAATYTP